MTSDELKSYLESRKAPESLVSFIFCLTPTAIDRVCVLTDALRPSANTLRDILHLADEISARDGFPIENLLSSKEVSHILEHPDRKVRSKNLKDYLQELRFPQLAEIKQKLDSRVEEIANQVGLRLTLPQNLEGDTICANISIKTPDDCAKYAKILGDLEQSPALNEIFSILRGQA